MLPDLNASAVFMKVVQNGSFTSAARALGMPKSTVSLRVSELEERLGVRLLQRTTRRSSVTDQGRVYFDRCVRIFAELEEAESAVTTMQQSPRGLLRVTLPASTHFLSKLLVGFLGEWEEMRVDVLFTDRRVDLVEESFDLAIRAGSLADSSLVARTLGVFDFVLVGSPGYLEKRGRPRSPRDLSAHRCLVFNVGERPRTWRLARGSDALDLDLTPVLAANDIDILHDAVLRGLGIAILPAYLCANDLRAKRLQRLLPEWAAPSETFHAVYPSGRHLSPKVKRLVEHLQRSMSGAPLELPGR